MELLALELRLLDLDLVQPLGTAIGIHAHRPIVLVRIETEDAVGYGECAALEAPTYTEEYASGAFLVLTEQLIPRLLAPGRELADAAEGLARLDDVRGQPMAKAAIEMALLDAQLRSSTTTTSLAAFLGATRTRIAAGATIGLGGVSEVLESVERAVAAGYRQVKVKITPANGAEVLRVLRAEHPSLSIAADANGSYDLAEDRASLTALAALELAFVEQPLAKDDLAGHARLVEAGLPVVLDESVTTPAELEAALNLRACVGVAIKPARVGGLPRAVAFAQRCADEEISAGVGGMLESGIGRAAALALAGVRSFDLPSDLGASDRYFVPDLTAPHELDDGELVLPTGPGLGIEVDTERVRAVTRPAHHRCF